MLKSATWTNCECYCGSHSWSHSWAIQSVAPLIDDHADKVKYRGSLQDPLCKLIKNILQTFHCRAETGIYRDRIEICCTLLIPTNYKHSTVFNTHFWGVIWMHENIWSGSVDMWDGIWDMKKDVQIFTGSHFAGCKVGADLWCVDDYYFIAISSCWNLSMNIW